MTRKSFLITVAALVVLIAGLIWLNIMEDNRQTWNTEHPMVNSNVSWEQTFYSGAWNGRET